MTLDISSRIYAEQIKSQYASLPASFLGSVFSAGTYLAVVHPVLPTWQWVLWAALMAAQAVGRGLLWWAYQHRSVDADDIRLWGHRTLLGSAVSGCFWGMGAWLVFPVDHVEYQLFFMFLVASMGSLSAIASASYLPAFYAYTLPTILPIAVTLVFQNSLLLRILGLISLGYLPVISTFAHNLGRSVIESFRLRFENLDLLRLVTERKEQVEEMNREKSMFLAAASHDLRQPLHALALHAHLLGSTRLVPAQQQLVDGMRGAIEAMTSLFDALLDMSRLDAGVIQVRLAPLRVQDLFDRLLAQFQADAQERKLTLRFRATRAMVQSDDQLLYSLLGNLVSNAIRYTQQGGILVAARGRAGGIQIEVWDTGCGIAEQDQRAIFKPFHQVGNPERDRSKGLGLGLAIVERLAHLLGSRLSLCSKVDRGTRFSLVLPAAQEMTLARTDIAAAAPVHSVRLAGPATVMAEAAAATRTVVAAADTAASPAPDILSAQPLLNVVVVLVENEVQIRAAMTLLLESWGCSVLGASSARDALAHVGSMKSKPHLLMCDYRLGADVTGLQLIDQIREEFNANIPALLITGDTGPGLLQDAASADCMVLHKPLNPAVLQRCMALLLTTPPA